MTLKQEVLELIDELPEDSVSLRDIRESLRLNKALDEAKEDVRAGRVYTSEEVLAEINKRWPPKVSE
jgi:hypothetical protein